MFIALATLALLLTLARLVWIDVRSFRLPDIYTLPLIVAGLGMALLSGRALLWPIALPFALLVVVGLLWGQRLGQRLAPHKVQGAFAVLVLGVAVMLIHDAVT